MELSIIIPIYNEEANIAELYKRLKAVVQNISSAHELIFVNDGSKDSSMLLIYELAQVDSTVKYIDFSRNFGHQIAVSAGIDYAKGRKIAIIDADLQDPPELITDLYVKMCEGFHVVYAKRKSRKGDSWFKKTTAKWFYRIQAKATSIDIPLDTGDFRIIDQRVAEVLRRMPEKQKYVRGQVAWIGFKQTYIEYDRNERNAGTTGYTLSKMLKMALDGITSYSNLPLKFATLAGFAVSAMSFLLMLYALYSRFISKDYQPGWTSLMLVVLFIGGIQLICIGIIGEYISRLSENVRGRPLYVVNEMNIDKA